MKALFKRIIADFHETSLPELTPRELEIPLEIEKPISIVGPRRAGKTFYLYQTISALEERGVDRRQIVYINFEDERLSLSGDNDVILDAYREMYPDRNLKEVYFFFDEIQELPGWEKFVRRLVDTVSSRIFFTGSNARLLSREIATSLRGRSLSFEILPLSFREYLLFKGATPKPAVSSRERALQSRAFEQYLYWGGFPEILQVEERFRIKVLQEYFNVMLYRDLVERFNITDVSVLKFLLKRLISSFTKEFSINKLYKELKSRGFSIGKDALYNLTEEIFSIYMLASVEKYDPSVVRREMSNRKVYLLDNGFSTALHYAFSEDFGKLLENLVYCHLRGLSEDIYFVRNGWECDFAVWRTGAKPLLVQVTQELDEHTITREVKGLTGAMGYLDDADNILLYRSIQKGLEVPEMINTMEITEWLLAS